MFSGAISGAARNLPLLVTFFLATDRNDKKKRFAQFQIIGSNQTIFSFCKRLMKKQFLTPMPVLFFATAFSQKLTSTQPQRLSWQRSTGIGNAEAIAAYRTANGNFASVDTY